MTDHLTVAVNRLAAEHGADPAALLDSTAFTAAAGAIATDAGDYDRQLGAAISTAVRDRPRLAAASRSGATTATGRDEYARRHPRTRSDGQGGTDGAGQPERGTIAAGRDLYRQQHPGTQRRTDRASRTSEWGTQS
ncbi:hypothetical protein ACQPX6_10270 [Actinomycetospora sp. CA-101289]|uniref:hypothetical protein n=1 Tax=Actinomycetospora sp. CA-101289 TaxID=3239893 RepID=UPI003D981D74